MKMTVTLIGLSLVLLFVWERVDVVRVGYLVERLKAQKAVLERERDELQLKFSTITAPERIAKVATEKLGLAPPEPGQVVLVRPERETPSVAPLPHPEIRIAKHEIARGSR